MTAGWIKKSIPVILIILAASLITPAYQYALEMGVNADLATIAYLAGLPVGMIIMLIGGLLARGSDRSGEGREGTPAGTASGISSKTSKRLIFALILIAIMVLAVYPVRVYAPQAKVLFIPLVYWFGVILGAAFGWIIVSPKIRDTEAEQIENNAGARDSNDR